MALDMHRLMQRRRRIIRARHDRVGPVQLRADGVPAVGRADDAPDGLGVARADLLATDVARHRVEFRLLVVGLEVPHVAAGGRGGVGGGGEEEA